MPIPKGPPRSRSPSPTPRPPPLPPPPPDWTSPHRAPRPSTPSATDKASGASTAPAQEAGDHSPGPPGYTLADYASPPFDVLVHAIGARTETISLVFQHGTPLWQWDDAVPDLLACMRAQRARRPHAAPFGGSIYCEGRIRFYLEVPAAMPGGQSYIMQFVHRGHLVFDTETEEAAEATEAWMSTVPLNPSFGEEWALEIVGFLLACARVTVWRERVRIYRERMKR